MEGAPPPAAATALGRREPSVDAVKAQGILASLTAKERAMAREWSATWGFYTRAEEMMEEEALALGLSREQYRAAKRELSGEPAPARYPVRVEPSPNPPPATTSGEVGWRATCPLERYGRLVRSQRDHPLRPPLPPGQFYDPYKQTFVFIGVDCGGDPISFRLPTRGADLPEAPWGPPVRLSAAQLCPEALERARRRV